MLWQKKIDNEYGIKELDEYDYPALKRYCIECTHEGMVNNSSFDELNISSIHGDSGKYLCTYHISSGTIVNVCATQHFPIQLDCWGKDKVYECYRIGVRNGTLKDWRQEFVKGLSWIPNLSLNHIYPIQIRWALMKGAKKIIVTTNNKGVDSSGKMFKVDKIMHILAKKKCFYHIASDINIFGASQNVWELNMEYWKNKI